MTKPFDPTKPVQTRDGRAARIIATDARNPTYPLVALITAGDCVEYVGTFTRMGLALDKNQICEDDLVNISEVRVVYGNLYVDAYGDLEVAEYLSLEDARMAANSATLKITYTGDEITNIEMVQQ